MSLLRPLYQNNYLPSSPHIYPHRYQENYCTKQDKEVFYGHFFFSLSGVSSMCRQIKPQAGPLASCCRRRRGFFVLFVCFFPLLLILPALERKTNKQTLLKKRERKKQIYRDRIFSYMQLAFHVLQETL